MYNFKNIQKVPGADELVDIVFNSVQRKTATVIHKNQQLSQIRKFYTTKVKYASQLFHDKFTRILDDFPQIDEIHPFYSFLMNVRYNRSHYKIALGQITIVRGIIDKIAKESCAMLNHASSAYRCKRLKIAALGRMRSAMRRQKDSLAYLERVRADIGRLPQIDTDSSTIILCGMPNVGKSSCINVLTHADVEVMDVAFTTKALQVGHCDYNLIKYQVIDTPGLLLRDLDQRNTIEMQALAALAHLEACAVFFIDISETCGETIESQCQLFKELLPVFRNKPVVFLLNKTDIRNPDDLSDEEKAMIDECVDLLPNTFIQPASTLTKEGVMAVKEIACQKLIEHSVANHAGTKSFLDVQKRMFTAIPDGDWEPVIFLPDTVQDPSLIENPIEVYAKDLQRLSGGAGSYAPDKKYYLEDEEWTNDPIPEIYNGKNVADFVDREINEKMNALENQEQERELTVDRSEIERPPKHDPHREQETVVKNKSARFEIDAQRARTDLALMDDEEIGVVIPKRITDSNNEQGQKYHKELKKQKNVRAHQRILAAQEKMNVNFMPKHLYSGKRRLKDHDWR
eukprot:TRINITY_DN2510_c0_g1_i1.p1 TRINITY_DN2510_c0_g1~~TRINITY_DN2510_c0_g1_i1.p1  ORF type:complete len:571 (-),score=170.21 TRINITY_DN2510_c0_g1_i1:113-1825(-)